MMMASWAEIKGEIKHTYNEIEIAYQKHVISAVDKVKERPLLNTVVKMTLPVIPIIGPGLKELYDDIGGGRKSEEDKVKQTDEFLGKLEPQNNEQFDRIAQHLKTNSHATVNAIIENRISLTDLISKPLAEIREEVRSVKEDAKVIRGILEKELPAHIEVKRSPKPSRFRGESIKIFVGRKR